MESKTSCASAKAVFIGKLGPHLGNWKRSLERAGGVGSEPAMRYVAAVFSNYLDDDLGWCGTFPDVDPLFGDEALAFACYAALLAPQLAIREMARRMDDGFPMSRRKSDFNAEEISSIADFSLAFTKFLAGRKRTFEAMIQ